MEEIKRRIEEILKQFFEELDLSPKEQNDATLNESGINSVQFIKLLVYLENEFDIEFDDESLNIEAFKTIDDLAEYIYNLKNS